ncbi:MAG: hypothetical protein PWR02_1006 [Synergistales bacterium]|nr:hypothetical protein [Synergistales bacterium]
MGAVDAQKIHGDSCDSIELIRVLLFPIRDFFAPVFLLKRNLKFFWEKGPFGLHFMSTFDIIMVVMFFVKAQGKEEPGIPDSFEGFIRFAF